MVQEPPAAPYGANRERLRGQQETLTALIRWAVDQQVRVGDQLRALESPEIPPKVAPTVSPEELDEMLEAGRKAQQRPAGAARRRRTG